MQSRPWNGALAALAFACMLADPLAVAAADAPAGGVKPADKPKATLKSAMADVGDISAEVKQLEKRLASIDQSVAAIGQSLKRIESMDKSLTSVSNSLVPVGDTRAARGPEDPRGGNQRGGVRPGGRPDLRGDRLRGGAHRPRPRALEQSRPAR